MRRFALRIAASLGLVTLACAGARLRPAPAPHAIATSINDEMSVRELGHQAYLVTLEKLYASNVLVVGMPERTVVICSSPYDDESTMALVGWIRRTLKPRRIIAINTHFHPDGTGGNDAYVREGVETYASDLTQALLRERGERVRDQTAAGLSDPERRSRVARMRVVPAAHTFDAHRGLSFAIGGEEVRVVYPGPAHSPDNVVVHFPRRRLLFGGCMIRSDRSIGYKGDADLGHWEAAVRSVQGLAADVVIPGHGAPGGPELFALTIDTVRVAVAPHE